MITKCDECKGANIERVGGGERERVFRQRMYLCKDCGNVMFEKF